MTPEQIEHFRTKLGAMLAELESDDARGADSRKVVELDQQSVGRLSRMDALQQQAMALAGGRRREDQARRIRAALERIADGSYGECVDCAEPIPVARLDLDPTAPRCVSCARG
jgi:DnaK suppressor protein